MGLAGARGAGSSGDEQWRRRLGFTRKGDLSGKNRRGKGLQAPGGMEEAYSGESRRREALGCFVHGELEEAGTGARRRARRSVAEARGWRKMGSWMDVGARGVVDWSMAHGFARI